LPGGASRSYGIQVAKLAGLPPGVIERAGEILGNLERGELNSAGLPRIAGRRAGKEAGPYGQMNLPNPATPPGGPVTEELKNLDIDSVTPVEALNILNKMKGMLNE
ncbi:MAG: DNA mismatch repair protein MutS, partial [Deltaproteobacteria bacterium]|nr:DNA mismatch repair protein MutS [Deltaproteobacteria bacterium]